MLATVRFDPAVAAQFNARPDQLEPNDAAEVDRLVNEYGATLEIDIRRK